MLHRALITILSAAALLGTAASAPGGPSRHLSAFHDLSAPRQLATAYTPDQIAAAYDYTPLLDQGIDGSGETIALIEIDALDGPGLQQFDATYGLPAPDIQEYEVGGQGFRKGKTAETTADVEWVHALAPGAAIQIYSLDNNQPMWTAWRAMASALRSAADRNAAAISISLGTCGPDAGSSAAATAFSDLMRRGVTVFVSSGDSGDHPGPVKYCGKKMGVSYPSGDPSVVSVGGTSLRINDDGAIASEVGWRLSGGGRVRSLLRPIWQISPNIPHGKYRWAPDVSFVGDPRTGLSMYYKGSWRQVGGTSMGAPAWAAAWALIRQSVDQSGGSTTQAAPALLYRLGNSPAYGRIFHDVTSGSNGHYQAKPGWDAVTGWGTPDVAAMADAIGTASSG